MFCSNCGKPNGNVPYCQHCGSPLKAETPAPVKEENSVIIGDNVFAIAGFLLSFFSCPLPGLVFSILGFIQRKKLDGKGTFLSVLGFLLSAPAVLLGVILFFCVLFIPPFGQYVLELVFQIMWQTEVFISNLGF